MDIAVYGAAFDPPHKGHCDAIEQLLKKHKQVLVAPSARHAFGKDMAPFHIRLAMTKASINEHIPAPSINRLILSDMEKTIMNKKPNHDPVFSFDLLRAVQRQYPGKSIVLAIGDDNADPSVWQRFHRWHDIEKHYGVSTVRQRIGARSTDCRKLAHDRTQESLKALEAYVGHDVSKIILSENLYCCDKTSNSLR